MSAVEPPKPPRWVRLVVVLVMAGVAWLGVAVGWMAFQMWPGQTVAVVAVAVAFVAGALWGRRPLPDVELVHERKDSAIEACMDTAFELQQLSGEVPVVDDDTGAGTIAHLRGRPYDAAVEVPLCSWCLEPAAGRIDVTVGNATWRDLPACAACPDLIRVGDIDPATALPDLAATTYGRRLA